jgi:hypothetical protein
MLPICSLKLQGSLWVRGRSLGLVFPKSHCLAVGTCVCSHPGRWCQVVACSYCYFCSQKEKWDRTASKLVFWRICHVFECECMCCWGGGSESLRCVVRFESLGTSCPWPAVYGSSSLKPWGKTKGELGWGQIPRSAPWTAPRCLVVMIPWQTRLGLLSLLFWSLESASTKDGNSFCLFCDWRDWDTRVTAWDVVIQQRRLLG